MDRSHTTEEAFVEHVGHESVERVVRVGFDEFYRTARLPMVRLAFLLTGSSGVADEAVHDAFVKVLDRWDRIEDHHAYLRRCVVNECHTWHRRRFLARRREHLLAGADHHLDQYRDLSDALAQLSTRRRAVVVLRFYEGLPLGDIADVLRISEGTVKSTLHRGLAHLKELLDDH